ncbi:MAG: radical SAM family heme chaperone HemW [bacterium]|nr:radical SAM family heme chaperone HemW [bacterium]
MSPIYSIYLHLPFCREICPFCAFAVLKDRGREKDFYLELMRAEWALLGQRFALDFAPLRSVYLGGGTPSRLSLAELESLLAMLPDLGPAVQVSMELNPEDVDLAYAKGLKALGVNRVSLGVQSFDAGCLKALGRVHGPKDNHRALEALEAAGLKDFNLDLIFGYPGQSPAQLRADIKGALASGATHLSLYALSIEAGSKLAVKPQWAAWVQAQEKDIAAAYLQSIEQIRQAGMRQYEVSNFALAGFESRQNQSNWNRENYLGLGMGAHGLVDDQRYANHRRLKEYRQGLKSAQLPWDLDEVLGAEEAQSEAWMLGLRRPEGVLLADFNLQWGPDFERAQQAGWLKLAGGRLSLTPQGLLLADELTAYFWARQN